MSVCTTLCLEAIQNVVIGIACISGLGVLVRWRTAVRPLAAMSVVVLFGLLQLVALPQDLVTFRCRGALLTADGRRAPSGRGQLVSRGMRDLHEQEAKRDP